MSEERSIALIEPNGHVSAEPTLDVFSTVPRTLDGVMAFCDTLAKSDLVPKDYHGKPANIMVAIQCGSEVGLSPMQSIQSIAVINGRPAMWGDAPLGLVQASGKMEYIKEWEEGETACCETKRRGYPEPHVTKFSQEDAKRMGLAGKQGPWSQIPKRMRQLRARAFNLRNQYADVLKGVSVAEEIVDIAPPTPEPATPIVTQEDKRAAIRERMQKMVAQQPEPTTEPQTEAPEPEQAPPSDIETVLSDYRASMECKTSLKDLTEVMNEFEANPDLSMEQKAGLRHFAKQQMARFTKK